MQPDLSYIEHPVKILDEKERVTRNSVVKFYKVQWQNHSEDEATWEQERYLEALSPPSFQFTEVIVQIEMYFLSLLSHQAHEILGRDFVYGGQICNTLGVTL